MAAVRFYLKVKMRNWGSPNFFYFMLKPFTLSLLIWVFLGIGHLAAGVQIQPTGKDWLLHQPDYSATVLVQDPTILKGHSRYRVTKLGQWYRFDLEAPNSKPKFTPKITIFSFELKVKKAVLLDTNECLDPPPDDQIPKGICQELLEDPTLVFHVAGKQKFGNRECVKILVERKSSGTNATVYIAPDLNNLIVGFEDQVDKVRYQLTNISLTVSEKEFFFPNCFQIPKNDGAEKSNNSMHTDSLPPVSSM